MPRLSLLIAALTLLGACGDKDAADTAEEIDTADTGTPDEDGDGYASDVDCDDADPAVNPGAEEICNGIDDDCDGREDADASDATIWFIDGDGDGHGADGADGIAACEAPADHVANSGDCDDGDDAYHPGAPEHDCADPNDYNCDGSVAYEDSDGDGFAACEECDDGDAAVNPAATEICNDLDDDCDGLTDPEASADAATWHIDFDGDGYGAPSDYDATACDQPAGYITPGEEDCDDGDAAVSPAATEICNDLDDDCDGLTDPDDAADAATWYADADADGYGDAGSTDVSCDQPAGHTSDDADCDDSDAAVSPAATEICNDLDDDCDGDVDPEASADAATWYADADADGYTDADATTVACADTDGEGPSGYLAEATEADCDDGDADAHPGADETCDDDDDDCDGAVDESPVDGVGWAPDLDEDGYGDPDGAVIRCDDPGDGSVADANDCDDGDATAYPGAPEICDGAQNDCDEASWVSDEGLAHFAGDDGTWTDLASTFAAGAAGAPVSWSFDRDGELAICGGVWYLGLDATAVTASVVGPEGAELTTLDGGETDGVVTGASADLTIQGLTLTGAPYDAGDLIYTEGGALTLREVSITGNTTDDMLLDVWSGDLTIEDSQITDNTVEGDLLLYLEAGDLTISGSTFSGNTTSNSLIETWEVHATIEDSAFEDNGASNSLVYLGYGTGSVSGTRFADNASDYSALYVDSESVMTLDGLTFEGNSGSVGGGLAVEYLSEATLTDSAFTDNEVTGDGGALYVGVEVTLAVSGCSFTNNTAAYGGAIAALDGAEATLTDLTVSGGQALYGGAVYVGGGTSVSVSGGGFDGGAAIYGGLFAVEEDTLAIEGADLSGGWATYGGAIYAAAATIDLTDTTLSDNTAEVGGAIYGEEGAALTASGGAVRDNLAFGEGGGIYLDGEGTLDGTEIADNVSDDGGGGLYVEGEIVLTDCAISRNESNGSGGGLYLDGEGALTDTDFADNTGSNGGGLYHAWSEAGEVSVTGGVFSGNEAIIGGGASLSVGYLSDVVFTDNEVRYSGGGLSVDYEAWLDGVTITDNSAQNFGGGLYVNNAYVEGTGCAITGNDPDEVYSQGAAYTPGADFVCDGTCE